MKYSYNNKHNITFQDHYEQHPSKVKYQSKTVPKLVIRCIGDTTYDYYISETLVPLKSAIKPKKQMRFSRDPVTSVNTIPVRRTRPHPPKWTIKAGDPDLLMQIELSQARADTDLNQDLRGNLSVMSSSKSHHTEETLPTMPLGQFHAQRSDNTTTNNIAHSDTQTPSQSEIFSSYNNQSDISTYTLSQSEISDYNANRESSSRETSRPSSPESGNLTVRILYSPLPEMAIVHRSIHDAIHAVREQHGRAVTRSLLTQQKALAAMKLQCNAQIKRTSTPDPPSMSNVPPRQARARLEKDNGVTSGSSEKSDCEPQTASKARFEALKGWFKTPTKSKEETPSHSVPLKRQRLFHTPSSESATECPPANDASGPSQRRSRSSATASEGD